MNRAGKRRFSECELKTVKLQKVFRDRHHTGAGWSIEKPKGFVDTRFVAVLECPKTRSQDIYLDGSIEIYRESAVESMKNVAAVTVCGTCRLSKLDPVELEEHEAAQLEARAKRIEAQNRLALAEKESERIKALGMPTVAAINSRFAID